MHCLFPRHSLHQHPCRSTASAISTVHDLLVQPPQYYRCSPPANVPTFLCCTPGNANTRHVTTLRHFDRQPHSIGLRIMAAVMRGVIPPANPSNALSAFDISPSVSFSSMLAKFPFYTVFSILLWCASRCCTNLYCHNVLGLGLEE